MVTVRETPVRDQGARAKILTLTHHLSPPPLSLPSVIYIHPWATGSLLCVFPPQVSPLLASLRGDNIWG